MTKKEKKRLIRILIALGALLIAWFVPFGNIFNLSESNAGNVELMAFLIAYLIAGGDVIREAAENILHGQVFDENFLMAVATVGAFIVGEYPEGVAVMLFYQVGELFQSYAVNRSRKSISELMDIKPDFANVKKADGGIKTVAPGEVNIGDIIVVKPGERIPLDGIVVKGNASVDTSALTGESLPREVENGDNVISGSVNLNGLIEVKVEKKFSESTVSRILELVENASLKKAPAEKFITRFARYYTPIVVLLAVALAVIPPIILGGNVWYDWIYRALTFLVISCPCALVISVPLSFFGGIGAASSKGVLVKGSNYLEELAKCDIVMFDKTGTLTKGNFKVTKINTQPDIDENQVLEAAAICETNSNHPIALSIMKAYGKSIGKAEIKVNEIAGHGIEAEHNNKKYYAGNTKLMKQIGITVDNDDIGTIVYVAVDNKYYGNIVISDEIKETSKKAIEQLKKCGVHKTVMLTGDRAVIAEDVAKKIGVSDVFAELLPGDKVDKVEEILKTKNENSRVAFVGDGINDAPVLARADVGIAMGALGSDAAIEAADVVIMDDNPQGIAKAIKIARKTIVIVKENIVFALGVKVLILILAAFGIANMWAAVFADVGVAVIAILNALRALSTKQN